MSNGLNCAPIALFSYSRPKHLKLVIEALARNPSAHKTPLYIFCDAPKDDGQEENCKLVRRIAHEANGFSQKHVIERAYNYGLAKSITEGVSQLLEIYDRVIVLEDDLVVSPFFLKFMNDALNLYENSQMVAAINGYLLPLEAQVPETFFLKGADCWGWATWRRSWRFFNPNGAELLSEIYSRGLTREFDLNGSYPYTKMLKDQALGRNQSWAIRWQASVFLRGMLTLYPGRSLVKNIGHDNSGVHCNISNDFDVTLSDTPISLQLLPISESPLALIAVVNFYKKIRWLPRRVIRYASALSLGLFIRR